MRTNIGVSVADRAQVGLAELMKRMRVIEAGHSCHTKAVCPFIQTPWGRFRSGTVHEWLADTAPLSVWGQWVRQLHQKRGGWVFWVGRRCWPYPISIVRACGGERRLMHQSVFVDLPRRSDSVWVWAIDLVLRCPATAVVVADARGLSMNQSRRLQLAAESGAALALLWRRQEELKALSAAHHRWRICPERSPGRCPRWRIEHVRCKEQWAQRQVGRSYLVEQNDAQGFVVVPTDVVDRPGASADAAETRAGRRTA